MFKRNLKSALTWGMILVLMVSSLAACSGNNKGSEGTNAPAESTAPTAAPTPEEPVELLWLGNPGATPLSNDTQGQKYIEEKYNVKITIMNLDPNSPAEQLNIKIATGEIPDIWWMKNSDDLFTYAKQGVLAELPVAQIKEKMPEYAKTVDDLDPNLWVYGLYEGKSYGIPQYWEDGNTPYFTAYNKKWLNQVGYTEAPKTLQEYEDIIYKFRNDDPDGNGKKDTYGISAIGKGGLTPAFNEVFGAHRAGWTNWIEDKDGKLVFGMTTEGARASFKLLNKWFKDGVIDPEFITQDSDQYYKNFASGRVGIIDDGLWYGYNTAWGGIGSKAKEAGTDFVVGQPLAGSDGPGANFAYGTKNAYVAVGVNAAKDQRKMDKIYEILRDTSSDEEIYLRVSYGELGVHYDMINGIPTMKEEFSGLEGQRKIGVASFFRLFNGKVSTFKKYDWEPDLLVLRKDLVGEGTPVASQVSKVTFGLPSQAKYPDLTKMQEEYFMKFILGNVDLDLGFDDFVKLWNQSGGQVLTDEANQMYKELFN